MIKSYKLFLESKEETTFSPEVIKTIMEPRVDAICKKYGITNWSINPDTGLVDIDGFVNLVNIQLTKLPLNFGKISGDFKCQHNKLTSLEGCPYEVGGDFYCNENKLTSLYGCSKKVTGGFWCSYNEITSLKGCPNTVDTFSCARNKLTSLEGCPQEVSGNFYCYENNITSLEGIGKVGKLLDCHNNKIVNLEGLNGSYINGLNNPISKLGDIGNSMIDNEISFLESVMMYIHKISDLEMGLIMNTIEPQKILDLNDFKIFNLLRTNLPKKYAEVMSLRDISVESDLGELGF